MACRVSVAVATFWLLASTAAAAPTGQLAPKIFIAGKPADGRCALSATQIGNVDEPHTGASPKAEPIDLPAGRYSVRVTCKDGKRTLSPPLGPVSIRAGKASTPTVRVTSSRLRVMVKRNGARKAAKVQLFAPRSSADDPLAEGAANLKFDVASGRYDVLVALEDGSSQAWLRSVSVSGTKVTEKIADLSDGTIIVSVKHNGKPTDAGVRIFAADGKTQVALPNPGDEIALAPGKYFVQTTLLDAADLASERKEVWVKPRKTTRHAKAFSTGTLTVSVSRDRKPLDATVHLSLPGASDFFNYFPAPGTVSLSPGKYDVTIELSGPGPEQMTKTTRVSARRNQKLKFDVTPATLDVQILKSGRRAVTADFVVRGAGGGKETGATDANGKLRLWPGRYEIMVSLADGSEIVDGPFDVKLGQRLKRVIRYARGTLNVSATRGPEAAADAEVAVYRPGAKVPVARALAQSQIELPPGVYDVKVVAGHESRWKERVRITAGRTAKLEVAFTPPKNAANLPEGEIPEMADDLPEGDADPLPEGDAD